jgi:hypothetical protein
MLIMHNAQSMRILERVYRDLYLICITTSAAGLFMLHLHVKFSLKSLEVDHVLLKYRMFNGNVEYDFTHVRTNYGYNTHIATKT